MLALALVLQVMLLAPAAAQPTATWTGGGGNSRWDNPANWNPPAVPDNNTVIVASPIFQADIRADASITGSLNIGQAGSEGFLGIFNKSTFTRSTGPVGIFIGSGVNHSTLIISDGSQITSTGLGAIRVGEIGPAPIGSAGAPGSGKLFVENGASISGAQIYIGYVAGSTGEVTVNGKGSSIFVPAANGHGWVSVGFSGNGTLNILNGGVVVSEVAEIATSTGDGSVTVQGPGSLWNVNGPGTRDFHIGGAGTGSLQVLQGGKVDAEVSPIVIGGDKGANGDVVVDGDGSTLTNTRSLTVGAAGNGTLTVSNNGNVTTGTMHIAQLAGSFGRLLIGGVEGGTALAPGSVDASSIVFGSGDGKIVFNHTSDSYLFGAPISGPGAVRVENGTTIFTADNTYTKGTAIDVGATLQLGLGGTTGSVVGNVVNDGTLIFNRSNTYDFTGTISGPGSVAQNGTGTTIFSTPQTYTGTTNINAGTLEVNSTLASAAVNVNAGGTLSGIGVLAGHVVNAGTVAPGTSLGGFGTLTVASYAGLGGTLAIDTQLGDDSSPTDLLKVTGDTSGSTNVKVTNRGGKGALTDQGIEIVDVGGASDGFFNLQGNYLFYGVPAVIGGAYAYFLTKGSDGNWYLHSNLLKLAQEGLLPPAVPGGPPIPISPGVLPPGLPTSGPIYQPGVGLYETYPQILLGLMNLPTLRERVGNRYLAGGGMGYAAPGAYADGGMSYLRGPAADYVGAPERLDGRTVWWGQVEGRRASHEPAISKADATHKVDEVRLRTGFDALIHENAGGRLIGGFNVTQADARTRVRSVWGDGKLDTTAYGLGGSLTWFGTNGAYVDTQGLLMMFDTDLRSDLAGKMGDGEHARGYATGIEVGRRFAFAGPWAVTPQAQLKYADVRGDFTDTFGADVSIDDGESLLGRLGLAIEYRNAWLGAQGPTSAYVYGIGNLYYEFLDGTAVDISGTNFHANKDELWGGLGLGGTYSWAGDRYAVYGEVSYNTSLENFGDSHSVQGTAGLRIRW